MLNIMTEAYQVLPGTKVISDQKTVLYFIYNDMKI